MEGGEIISMQDAGLWEKGGKGKKGGLLCCMWEGGHPGDGRSVSCKKERIEGIFHCRFCSVFPASVVTGSPWKEFVFISWVEVEFMHSTADKYKLRCCFMCFSVSCALTNWRNTWPRAWLGWGSGCKPVSTADSTSLCSSRMSSMFENRIYMKKNDVKAGRFKGRKTRGGMVGSEGRG